MRLSGALAGLVVAFASLAFFSAPASDTTRPDSATDAPPEVPLGLTPRAGILIASDVDFTPANGVVAGTGTPSDPFVIEGWEINATGGVAVDIRDTTASFVVRDSTASDGDGIRLSRVTDGRIENVTLSRVGTGISVSESTRIILERNAVGLSYDGIVVGSSGGIELLGNNLSANYHYGIIAQSNPGPLRVVGNRVESNYEGGVYLSYTGSADLRSNTITGNGGHGVNMYNDPDANVTGNLVTGNAGRGLWIIECEGVSVTGNTVSGNAEGIFLAPHLRATVASNTISGNQDYGLMNYFSQGLVIDNNTFDGNGGAGVYLSEDTGMIFTRNSFRDDGLFFYGDYVYGSPVAQFDSHTITPDNLVNGLPIAYVRDCDGTVLDGVAVGQLIVANCTNARFANLTIADADLGVQLDFVSQSVLQGLRVTGNDVAGIRTFETSHVTIADSDILSNTNTGVEIVRSDNVTVEGTRITQNDHGLLAFHASDTVVRGTRVASNAVRGVAVYDSTRFELTSSNVTSNGVGIELSGSRGVLIADGSITGNQQGIALYGSGGGSTVRGNTIAGNDQGVYMLQGLSLSLYGNQFLGNRIHVNSVYSYPGFVSWDQGYPIGGNYWDTYSGRDDCSGPGQSVCPDPDGIGDTPFAIDAANRDNYPLATLPTSGNRRPYAAFSVAPTMGPPSVAFAFDASASWDREDGPASLPVRWDWESDGVFDTAWSTVKTTSHVFAATGEYTVRLEVQDSGGLVDNATQRVVVDGQPPLTTPVIVGTLGPSGWYLTSVSIILTATDDMTGVVRTEYRVDAGAWYNYSYGPLTMDRPVTFEFRSWDRAGNVEPIHTLDLRIDPRPPVTSVGLDGTRGRYDWFRSAVTVTLESRDDESGVAGIVYRIDSRPFQPYLGPFTLDEGDHVVGYRATDIAGNVEEERIVPVRIDRTAPRIDGLGPSGTFTRSDLLASWSVSDLSGVDEATVSVDGGPPSIATSPMPLSLADGDHRLHIAVMDRAGNVAEADTAFRVDTNLFSPTGPFHGIPMYSLFVTAAVVALLWWWDRRERRRGGAPANADATAGLDTAPSPPRR